ncbi:hypothetical protein P8452_34955 [Trifolium repens]|nr:hypothetical protein QL285_024149 [Trifolium repens]WJX48385.1 hypothetical protein P8452_34955 [Trifolium repens]
MPNTPCNIKIRQIPPCNFKIGKYPLAIVKRQSNTPPPNGVTLTVHVPSPVSTTQLESPSPSMSPMAQSLSKSLGSSSINAMVASLRNLQLGKLKSIPSMPVNRNI